MSVSLASLATPMRSYRLCRRTYGGLPTGCSAFRCASCCGSRPRAWPPSFYPLSSVSSVLTRTRVWHLLRRVERGARPRRRRRARLSYGPAPMRPALAHMAPRAAVRILDPSTEFYTKPTKCPLINYPSLLGKSALAPACPAAELRASQAMATQVPGTVGANRAAERAQRRVVADKAPEVWR